MHAVALSRECPVDFHVARLELKRRVDAKLGFVRRIIHVCFNPVHLLVAKLTILGTIARDTNVIGI